MPSTGLNMTVRPPAGWREYHGRSWGNIQWSSWVTLDADVLQSAPSEPGLYRVRHTSREGLSYIGESSDTNRRTRALARRTHNEEMPYRDPHTAAPCLWALQDKYGPGLEISYATPTSASDDQRRKAIEAALIASYRLEFGKSPPANFGRIIDGYEQSSYRRGGKRGGRINEVRTERNANLSYSPKSWNSWEQVLDRNWMGRTWSSTYQLSDRLDANPPDVGLYRLWDSGRVPPLTYIGESSNISRRLYTHEDTYGPEVLFSYTARPDLDDQNKREEAEIDLIGGHYISTGYSPLAQFGSTD